MQVVFESIWDKPRFTHVVTILPFTQKTFPEAGTFVNGSPIYCRPHAVTSPEIPFI